MAAATRGKRIEKLAKAKRTYGGREKLNSRRLLHYVARGEWKEKDEKGKMQERSARVSGCCKAANKGELSALIFRRHKEIIPAQKLRIMIVA